MINDDISKMLGIKLNPCNLCEKQAEININHYSSRTTVFNEHYHVLIKCSCCNNYMEEIIPIEWSDSRFGVDKEIRRLVEKWNSQETSADSSLTIDAKLQGFDKDQKSLVCILLYLAGYKLSPEDLSRYVEHNGINIRGTFESMTLKQKSKAFVMVGEALGYLPEGDVIK